MNKKAFLSLVVGALVMFSQSSHAADCSNDHTGAVIAGSVAGGASAVAIGAGAATLSGAGVMSTLAMAGAGSAKVPRPIDASIHGYFYWLAIQNDEDSVKSLGINRNLSLIYSIEKEFMSSNNSKKGIPRC